MAAVLFHLLLDHVVKIEKRARRVAGKIDSWERAEKMGARGRADR
jgi:hypothetical protein